MLELLLTVCFAAGPEICADRWLPRSAGETGTCQEGGESRAKNWTGARDDLRLRDWRCVEPSALPRLEAEEVGPGILVHRGVVAEPDPQNGGDTANLAAVTGDDAVAVIDAGGSRAVGEAWLATIREATALPIRWLILTHMHPDHVLGAEPFVEAGATVIAHAKLERALASRAETYLDNYRRLLGEPDFIGTGVALPEELVDGHRSIDLGNRALRLEAHATAHTDNDLTVFDPATGILFAGDLVFLQHTPSLDGSITGWIEQLETLTAREDIDEVVPGHGPVMAEWPEAAQPTLDYLTALAAETRNAIDRGEPLSEAAETLGQDQRGGWKLFDVFNPRNATAAYKELEWE